MHVMFYSILLIKPFCLVDCNNNNNKNDDNNKNKNNKTVFTVYCYKTALYGRLSISEALEH